MNLYLSAIARTLSSAVMIGAAFLFLPCVIAASEPSPKAPDPFEQNKNLGRGVNIIGYDPLWTSRAKARMQSEHFKLIHEAGFGHVRIPLHPFRDGKAGKDNQINKAWFEALDWAVEQALANKLMVILDFHEFEAMGADPGGNKERFPAMWKQIAEHCKNLPSQVLFEILNEPNKKLTAEVWNGLLRDALAIIRKSNPTRTVIIGPVNWNNIDALKQLEIPEDDRNIIVTVHYYNPFPFTHQGTPWTDRKDKVGVTWNGTEKEQQAVEQDLAKAQTWSQQHKRPIYLGEFGAYEKGEMASRVRWTNFVARHAEKLGWSWAYWQFDGDFIVYDIPNKHWVEPIRDALIPSRRE